MSENNRRAKYYRLTRAGRKQRRAGDARRGSRPPSILARFLAPRRSRDGRLQGRLGALLSRLPHPAARRERDLDEELASHLELHVDDNLRAGMTPDEARRAGAPQAGRGRAGAASSYRDQQGLPTARHARPGRPARPAHDAAQPRLHRGRPGRARPRHRRQQRHVQPRQHAAAAPACRTRTRTACCACRPSAPILATRPPRCRTSTSTARATARSKGLASYYTGLARRHRQRRSGADPRPRSCRPTSSACCARRPSSGAISSRRRALGRPPRRDPDGRVLARRFAADPPVVGGPITLTTEPYTVVGVLPPGFSFLGFEFHALVPMSFAPGDNLNSHNNYFLTMVGRLRPDAPRPRRSRTSTPSRSRSSCQYPENRGTADRDEAPAGSAGRRREPAPCWCCSARSHSCCSSPARTWPT